MKLFSSLVIIYNDNEKYDVIKIIDFIINKRVKNLMYLNRKKKKCLMYKIKYKNCFK